MTEEIGHHLDEIIEEPVEDVNEPKEETVDDFVPPPRCPTNWIVRLSTEEEKKIFQVRNKLNLNLYINLYSVIFRKKSNLYNFVYFQGSRARTL